MARVYVINSLTHDYSKASRFGDVVYATEGKVPIFKTDTMLCILDDALQDYEEDDFLLISGPTLLCIMAYQTVVKILGGHPTIKLLVFDAKEQDYVIRHLTA